jgi:hypothetical protein
VRLSPVIRIERVPACCNLLLKTRSEALSQPTAAVSLTFCGQCGHLFNAEFDRELVDYGTSYENSLRGSQRFREYDDRLAAKLIERNGLRERKLVEIGCGRGEFLSILCRVGNNTGLGFDPSYVAAEAEELDALGIRVFPERFESRRRDLDADFVFSRHTLEHVEDPLNFLRGIAESIPRSGTFAFFEVPNGLFTLRDGGIWDLIHEHCSYFSPASLKKALELSGYSSIEVEEAFEGQFLNAHAKTGQLDRQEVAAETDWLEGLVHDFAEHYRTTIERWTLKLRYFEDRRSRVVVWGGGAKGTAFLNVLHPRNIEFIVDVNPIKQAKYIPVTGQEIVPPEFLREYQPGVIVVMNPNYREEIQKHVAELGIKAELVCV